MTPMLKYQLYSIKSIQLESAGKCSPSAVLRQAQVNYYQSNSRTHKLNKIPKGEHWKLTRKRNKKQKQTMR